MIIYIIIGIIVIIVMIAIFAYIYNGKGKGNKKFTFQYKQYNKNNHHNPIQHMFPMLKAINKQYNLPPPQVPMKKMPMEKMPVETVPVEKVSMEKMPMEKVSIEKMPVEKVSIEKVSIETVSMEKVPSEKVSISESNQKTESNIHNCEDNYIWNKYLKKCITTECPLESYTNCNNRSWTLPYNIIAPNPNPNVDVPTNVYTAGMGGLSPSLVEKICEQLNIPVPEEGEVCWSECQHKYVKLECPKMTMEECTASTPGYRWNDSPQATLLPLNPSLFTRGETCEEISRFTTEYQETLFWDTGTKNAVLPGEICWSAACQKCVKPYVKPLTREQGRIKHSFNPACFPNNQTCMRDPQIGANWFNSFYPPPGTPFFNPSTKLQNETCEAWSTFTEWNKYNLNPVVLPGEVCWSPCTGKCVAPLNY
jgi:hypothetical protein